MEDLRCNRQFLFTKDAIDFPGWNHAGIAEYHLYTHPHLEVTSASNERVELFLLGFFFDYRHPERSQNELLNSLLACASFGDLLGMTDDFSGRFVIIYRSQRELRVFHDAGGQREVFYDTGFSAFGSQVKLIEKVITGEELTDPEAIEFFQSEVFLKEKLFVGDRTHRGNIRRLMPNHYADIREGAVHRFFPVEPVARGILDDVTAQAVQMLQGYLRAASLRYPLDIGVTAGYDSRILFLASKDLSCHRFVQVRDEPDNPMDIKFALELGRAHQRVIEVRKGTGEGTDEAWQIYQASVDFPKSKKMRIIPSDKMIINGHLSEIARNYFSYHRKTANLQHYTGADLARMYYYKDSQYAASVYETWLNENKTLFDRTGYNTLDLFYWEERVGNWAARLKTEAALNSEIYSPFCSRSLLKLLLSIDKKHRDKYHSKLHDAMIHIMSPEASRIPINPTRTKKKIQRMKRLGLFRFDQKYGIISKILRHLPFK